MTIEKKYRPRCFFDVEVAGQPVGRVVFELFADVCPITCENFRALCTGEKGLGKTTNKLLHYKDGVFHRVVRNFMVQGGDFSAGNGSGGESIYGGTFKDENFQMKHDSAFLLSMANRGKDTNGSQFFIITQPTPHLDGVHVVFGRVISGQEIISEIENHKTDHNSRPFNDAKIANCGELVLKIKPKEKKKKADKSSSEEGEMSDEKSKKHKKHKKHSKKSKKEKKRKDSETTEPKKDDDEGEGVVGGGGGGGEEEEEGANVDCSVRAEEIPDIPSNNFLMRRTANNEEPKSRGGSFRAEGYQRRSKISRSGRKIKGRGFMRYRTPSPTGSRSGSETPPHWKQAQSRVRPLKEVLEAQKTQPSTTGETEDTENQTSRSPSPDRRGFFRDTVGEKRNYEHGGELGGEDEYEQRNYDSREGGRGGGGEGGAKQYDRYQNFESQQGGGGRGNRFNQRGRNRHQEWNSGGGGGGYREGWKDNRNQPLRTRNDRNGFHSEDEGGGGLSSPPRGGDRLQSSIIIRVINQKTNEDSMNPENPEKEHRESTKTSRHHRERRSRSREHSKRRRSKNRPEFNEEQPRKKRVFREDPAEEGNEYGRRKRSPGGTRGEEIMTNTLGGGEELGQSPLAILDPDKDIITADITDCPTPISTRKENEEDSNPRTRSSKEVKETSSRQESQTGKTGFEKKSSDYEEHIVAGKEVVGSKFQTETNLSKYDSTTSGYSKFSTISKYDSPPVSSKPSPLIPGLESASSIQFQSGIVESSASSGLLIPGLDLLSKPPVSFYAPPPSTGIIPGLGPVESEPPIPGLEPVYPVPAVIKKQIPEIASGINVSRIAGMNLLPKKVLPGFSRFGLKAKEDAGLIAANPVNDKPPEKKHGFIPIGLSRTSFDGSPGLYKPKGRFIPETTTRIPGLDDENEDEEGEEPPPPGTTGFELKIADISSIQLPPQPTTREQFKDSFRDSALAKNEDAKDIPMTTTSSKETEQKDPTQPITPILDMQPIATATGESKSKLDVSTVKEKSPLRSDRSRSDSRSRRNARRRSSNSRSRSRSTSRRRITPERYRRRPSPFRGGGGGNRRGGDYRSRGQWERWKPRRYSPNLNRRRSFSRNRRQSRSRSRNRAGGGGGGGARRSSPIPSSSSRRDASPRRNTGGMKRRSSPGGGGGSRSSRSTSRTRRGPAISRTRTSRSSSSKSSRSPPPSSNSRSRGKRTTGKNRSTSSSSN